MPVIEATLQILKNKMPKKQNPEINSQISLPLRDTFKKLVVTLESLSPEE